MHVSFQLGNINLMTLLTYNFFHLTMTVLSIHSTATYQAHILNLLGIFEYVRHWQAKTKSKQKNWSLPSKIFIYNFKTLHFISF